MAILDKFGEIATNKDLTGAGVAGLFFSNAIDISAGTATLHDLGKGRQLYARCQVTEAFVSAAGATIQWQVVVATDDDSSFFTTSNQFLVRSPTTPVFLNLGAADLPLNAEFILPIPPLAVHLSAPIGRRFMGVVWGLTDANTFTAGKMTVDIGDYKGPARNALYRTGFRGP